MSRRPCWQPNPIVIRSKSTAFGISPVEYPQIYGGITGNYIEIVQKWGFGMAPVKPEIDEKRKNAINRFLLFCSNPSIRFSENTLDDISETKGLFTRVWKQDQWDWFTLFDRMGRPGIRKCQRATNDLNSLRGYLKNKDNAEINDEYLEQIVENNFGLSFQKHLRFYIGDWKQKEQTGQIYVLSTREQRDILKIGYTERSVWDRIKEINSSTGVITPFGLRAVWALECAKITEKEIHTLFSEFRVRNDREFFRMDFKLAFKTITKLIIEKRIEEN